MHTRHSRRSTAVVAGARRLGVERVVQTHCTTSMDPLLSVVLSANSTTQQESRTQVSVSSKSVSDIYEYNYKQEGLAVASIVRNDPSTLPGDDPFPRARMHRDRNAR